MPSADYKVELVDADGKSDWRFAIVGDQVVDVSGATPGDVLTIQGDGSVAPALPSAGPQNLYVQPNNPGMAVPGLWIQTNVGGDPDAMTFWVEDGV